MYILEVLNALQVLTKSKIVNKKIAEILDIDPATLSRKKKANEMLTPDEVIKLEQAYKKMGYKFSLISHFSSSGEADLDDLSTSIYDDFDVNTLVAVPFYPTLEFSCGEGNFAPLASVPVEKFFVSAVMLGSKDPRDFFAIPAVGDSMEKAIYDKDLVLFKRCKPNEQIVDGKIYAFRYNGLEYIKTLHDNITEIIAISENDKKLDSNGEPIYKPVVLTDRNSLELCGRFKCRIEGF